MNSSNDSPEQLKISSVATPPIMSEPIHLTIPGPLPSWNDILGMEHWERAKVKSAIQEVFLSALRLSASDSSTKTTSVKNSMSIAADTLVSYQAMRQEKRRLRQAKKKLLAKQNNASK